MHPQLFLQTFWRTDIRPQVFVAMSFADQYAPRFTEVIAPAIHSIKVGNVPLEPLRVDLSKSGDSILTDIIDGIAHALVVLADISVVGRDSVTSIPYRNGNVMYEVGLALACRQPSEILLVRDDKERFLFDVSTIPHLTIDFTQKGAAIQRLQEELLARIRESKHVNDARVQLALASLSAEEMALLRIAAAYSPGAAWGYPDDGTVNFLRLAAIPRLLDKQLIKLVGQFEEGHPAYTFTQLGFVVANLVKDGVPQLKSDRPKSDEKQGAADKANG